MERFADRPPPLDCIVTLFRNDDDRIGWILPSALGPRLGPLTLA
jgi:hypothetical protein